MRSYAQFENKIVKGGRGVRAKPRAAAETGRTWRRLYEAWEQGGLRGHYDGERGRRGGRATDLVEDTRLRDFLRALRRRRQPAPGRASCVLGRRLARRALSAPAGSSCPRGCLRARRRRPSFSSRLPRVRPSFARSWPFFACSSSIRSASLVEAEHREALRAGHQPHRVELDLGPLALERVRIGVDAH